MVDLEKQKLDAETTLHLVEEALSALNVRKRFRHNDYTNDFVGTEDDENAIDAAAENLTQAVALLKPMAGY